METTQDNRKNLAPEPEAEPIGFELKKPGVELFRYLYDEDCIEIKVDLPRYPSGSRFYPSRLEPEADEPVAWGQPDACGNIVETINPEDKTHTKAPKGWADIYSVPLYTRPEPAIRKPMTDEEPKTHEPWCAYLTQMLMSNPPQRSKCNCKNTTAPRPEFVRLSEEEVTKILTSAYDMYSTICAVENRLAEKNHPPRPEPAIRKPMTEEEIKMALLIRGFPYDAFRAGIRFAEKHHFGIGGDDE